MSDPTVKIDIPFQTLVDALSKLNAKEKQKIWALLDAELYQNDECSPEELADIEAAQADYAVG